MLYDAAPTRSRAGTEDATTLISPVEMPTPHLSFAIFVTGGLHTFRLPTDGQLVIGRSSTCDIQISATAVSRRHALARLGSEVWLEDLGSNNGTYVEGRRLRLGERLRVSEGIRVRFGDVSAMLVACTDGVDPDFDDDPVLAEGSIGASGMVVRDAAMVAVCQMIARLAVGTISVLITGETGVGKERVAERIHHLSQRADRPFLKLNCAAFTETLLESELFGHEKGAFTGAAQARPGLLEAASGGTVFLDEIGELSLPAQAKLLRCLEQDEVLPVGAVRPRPIDVRFVAATNRDLAQQVRNGAFREDLYYRIAAATIWVPPLRERRGEIEELSLLFATEAAIKVGRPRVPSFSPEVTRRLVNGAWPGNIRELRNTVERAVLLCAGGLIEPSHLPAGHIELAALPAELVDDEQRRIVRALEACGGNQTIAARNLGISRVTLLRRLDRLGIPRPRKSPSTPPPHEPR